jgi:serine/threonine protein kinase
MLYFSERSCVLRLRHSPYHISCGCGKCSDHNFLCYWQEQIKNETYHCLRLKLMNGTLGDLFMRFSKLVKAHRGSMLRQLAMGLKDMKDLGIVHHDIRPQNILYTIQDGHILLQYCDYSVAAAVNTTQVDWWDPGEYRAPETCGDNFTNCTSADVWSFACVVYDLLNVQPGMKPLFFGALHGAEMKSLECVLQEERGRLGRQRQHVSFSDVFQTALLELLPYLQDDLKAIFLEPLSDVNHAEEVLCRMEQVLRPILFRRKVEAILGSSDFDHPVLVECLKFDPTQRADSERIINLLNPENGRPINPYNLRRKLKSYVITKRKPIKRHSCASLIR